MTHSITRIIDEFHESHKFSKFIRRQKISEFFSDHEVELGKETEKKKKYLARCHLMNQSRNVCTLNHRKYTFK